MNPDLKKFENADKINFYLIEFVNIISKLPILIVNILPISYRHMFSIFMLQLDIIILYIWSIIPADILSCKSNFVISDHVCYVDLDE